jgi:hypothetical protein
MKKLAAIICAAFLLTPCASAQTQSSSVELPGIAFLITADEPNLLKLVAPQGGLGPGGVTAGWAFEQLRAVDLNGITFVSHIRGNEELDVDFTRHPSSNPTIAYRGSYLVTAAAFPIFIPAGEVVATMSLTGTGQVTLTGGYTPHGGNTYQISITVCNETTTITLNEAIDTVTGQSIPGIQNIQTSAPDIEPDFTAPDVTTPVVPEPDDQPPKGGVIFAVLPAVFAGITAGVAFISKNKKGGLL